MNDFFAKSWVAPLLVATCLGAGAMAAWAVASMWALSIVSRAFFERAPQESLVVTLDGRALKYSRIVEGDVDRGVYRTLDGQSVAERGAPEAYGQELPGPLSTGEGSLAWASRIFGFYRSGESTIYWYLVCDGHPAGRGYFAGYNAESKHRVGYLGQAGFRSDMPPEGDQFPLKHSAMLAAESATYGQVPVGMRADYSPVFLCSDGKMLAIDLERRTIHQVEMPSTVLSIAGYQEPKLVDDEREAVYTWRVAARLADRIVLLDMQGEIVRTIVIPPSLRDRDLSLYNTVGPGVVLYVGAPGYPRLPGELYFADADGKITRHEEIDLFHERPELRRGQAWLAAEMLLSPLALCVVAFVSEPLSDFVAPDYPTALARSLADYALPLVTVSLISTVLAAWSFRRHRHYAPRTAAAWATFVLITGAPGLIGYLLHRRWPHRQRCDRCGVVVPRDRLECLACAGEFAAPAAEAIEIFA